MPMLTIAQSAPLAAPLVSLAGVAGVITPGTHSYKVSFMTALGETDPGPASIVLTTTAGNGQVNLSQIPLGDRTTIQRKIWRTAANGSTYKLLHTIPDNTTTDYLDNSQDALLGGDAPSAGANSTHLTIPLASNSLKPERIGTSSRVHGGGLRSTVRADKRVFECATVLLLDAVATLVEQRLANAQQCPCAGDLMTFTGGAAAFEGTVTDDVWRTAIGGDGKQFMRAITFTLREV
jgi:hypothetical protein